MHSEKKESPVSSKDWMIGSWLYTCCDYVSTYVPHDGKAGILSPYPVEVLIETPISQASEELRFSCLTKVIKL
jgi:hypothetical protein